MFLSWFLPHFSLLIPTACQWNHGYLQGNRLQREKALPLFNDSTTEIDLALPLGVALCSDMLPLNLRGKVNIYRLSCSGNSRNSRTLRVQAPNSAAGSLELQGALKFFKFIAASLGVSRSWDRLPRSATLGQPAMRADLGLETQGFWVSWRCSPWESQKLQSETE